MCGFVTILVLAPSAVHSAPPESLNLTLEPYLKEFGLPAIAAAVFKDGVIIASGACETRRSGQEIPVGIDDRFHLGSDSKSFTSLLAGEFVEKGRLRWDSTLGEVFPELKGKMDSDLAGSGFRFRDDDEYRRPAADKALTKLAADLYTRFFQARIAESL